jgi:hypothetical protein
MSLNAMRVRAVPASPANVVADAILRQPADSSKPRFAGSIPHTAMTDVDDEHPNHQSSSLSPIGAMV